MNIQNEFNLISNHTIFLFKENMISNLTTLEKKILFVASLAIGFVALCFLSLIPRQWSKKTAADKAYSKALEEIAKAKEEAAIAKKEAAKYQEEAIKAQDKAASFQKEAEKSKAEADQAKNRALDGVENSKPDQAMTRKIEKDDVAEIDVDVQALKIQIAKIKSEAKNNVAAIQKLYNEIVHAQKKEKALIQEITDLKDAKIKAETEAKQAKDQADKFKAEIEALKKIEAPQVAKPNDKQAIKPIMDAE